eukprot:2376180-Prymnesium_polylepis.1
MEGGRGRSPPRTAAACRSLSGRRTLCGRRASRSALRKRWRSPLASWRACRPLWSSWAAMDARMAHF